MQAPPTNTQSIDYGPLRHAVRGRVAVAGEPSYDELRFAWNVAIDHRPDVVVDAETVADVQAAVRFAASNGMNLTVQATGHGQPRACASGMLLRTARLNSVHIDRVERTARIGGGARWADVVGPAFEHRLAPISGSSPDVGVVGYLIGGGYGLLSRKYGLAVDHLRSATVVLADGRVVKASAESNPDLFWAIRGGGGAFGVIVEVEVGLVPHAHVFAGNVMFDAKLADRVVRDWARWTQTLPDEMSSTVCLITFPPVPFVPEFLQGRSMVMIVACGASGQVEAENALMPIRSMEGAEFDSFRWMPYTESGSAFNEPEDPMPATGNGVLLREFGDDAIDAFLSAMGPLAESPNLMVQVRHVGGAIARVPHGDTPMGDRRSAQYLAYWLGIPMPHNPPERIAAHAAQGIEALRPWSLGGAPLNWVGEGDISGRTIETVYDCASLARLRALKCALDPDNVFGSAGVGICVGEERS